MSAASPFAESSVLTQEKLAVPRLFQVLLHNDDYTTMEFVVTILMNVFRKTPDEATTVMLAVHAEGVGVAGVYPFEIAETKVAQVHDLARGAEFPLRCSLREVGA